MEESINIIIICPHCKEYVIIEQLNCKIFRHGSFKYNGTQIGPHLSKIECDNLKEKDLIWGCGKPFQLILNENNEYISVICDYI